MRINVPTHSTRFALLLILSAAVLPLPGAAAAQRSVVEGVTRADRSSDQGKKSKVVRVTGVLTDEGVECPALRGDDGKLYTLNRDAVEGFEIGDRVRVVGKVAERSFCLQGTTLDVLSIKPAK